MIYDPHNVDGNLAAAHAELHQLFEGLAADEQQVIDLCCDAFENSLQGSAARIEDHLAQVQSPTTRKVLAAELITIAMAKTVSVEETVSQLLERFPQHASLIQALSQTQSNRTKLTDTRGAAESTLGGQERARPTVANSFGRYELQEPVGEGSFGLVWSAFDKELHRRVAIKIPRAANLRPKDVERFLREAKLVAQLRHPNIVAVHETGSHNGTPFIVSDFVDGSTVDVWKSTSRRSLHDVTRLCVRIADALHHAHEAGIVHRDLKPTNILVDADDRPMVTDFGLAKNVADETSTIEGNVLGSPAYMSPEQARGDAYRSDRRTDVFSLGVVLYELIANVRPFIGSRQEVLHKVLNASPARPRSIDASISVDLETICLKALSKEPAQRYATAQEMADDLQRYLNGEPILARSISPVSRAWSWCNRNRALASSLAAAAGLLLFVAVAAPVVAYQRSLDARQLTTLSRETAAQLYVSNMNVVYDAWINQSNPRRTRQVLSQYKDSASEEDLRGFEWHLLNRLTEQPSQMQTGAAIQSLDTSPDGSLLAIAGQAEEILLIDIASREVVMTLPGQQNTGWSIRFSPGGSLVAATDKMGVRIWRVADGELQHEFAIAQAHSLSFSPTDDLLAVGSQDGKVRLVDVTTEHVELLGRHEPKLGMKGVAVNQLDFSPDGKRLVTASWNSQAIVWDIDSRTQLVELNEHEWWARQCAFSPDNNTVATTDTISIRLWDASTGELLRTIPFRGAEAIAFSPDGETFACGSWLNQIGVFSIHDDRPYVLRGHSALVYAVGFAPDGQLISGGKDGYVSFWNREKISDDNLLAEYDSSIRYAAISNAGDFAVLTCEDGSVHFLDTLTREEVQPTMSHTANRVRVAIRPDDKAIVLNDGGQVRLLSYPGLEEIATLTGESELDFIGVTFSPNGETLAVGTKSGQVLFCSATTGEQLEEPLQLAFPMAASIAYSPDGSQMAVSGQREIQVWDTATPHAPTTLTLSEGIREVRFSPDGELLAAACLDGFIHIWSPQSREKKAVLKGHGTYAMSLAFSPDGKTLVSGSADFKMKFWNLRTMKELVSIDEHQGSVTSLNFSRDGKTLLSTSWGRPGNPATASIWRID